jgi:hypothetical protein
MATSRRFGSKAQGLLALVASGFAVGLLMGLSVSPIAHAVVAGILGVLLAIVSALAGVEAPRPKVEGEAKDANAGSSEGKAGEALPGADARSARRPQLRVTPVPVACVVAGVTFGALCGIYARTHRLLMEDPAQVVERWVKVGLDKKFIAQRLFEASYPVDKSESEKKGDKKASETTPGPADQGVLYAGVSRSECTDLRAITRPDDLRRAMTSSTDARVRKFASRTADDAALKASVEELLCAESR